MKQATFIEKRKRFLQAMTLDCSVVPELTMHMESECAIQVEKAAAVDAECALEMQFSGITLDAEAHDVAEVSGMSAEMTLDNEIDAESNDGKEIESVNFGDMVTDVSIEAHERTAKDARVKQNTDFDSSITPNTVAPTEAQAVAETESEITIVAVSAEAHDVEVSQETEFTASITVNVEELEIHEVEVSEESVFDGEIELAATEAKDVEVSAECEIELAITPYARQRKRVFVSNDTEFDANITIAAYKHATIADTVGKTLNEFCGNMTLERACIVPV